MPGMLSLAVSDLAYTADEVLSPYVWVFLVSFGVCFVATPIMRKLALANGIVDWPDLRRKAHVEPVAYLGGVALFLGWLAGVVMCFFIVPHTVDVGVGSVAFPPTIIIGAAIITLVGFGDDVYGMPPRVKVGGQLLAAALLAGHTVGTDLASGAIEAVVGVIGVESSFIPGLGAQPHWLDPAYWVGAVIVTLLVLGGCNALNLIDGLDGLSSGVTGIAALGFAAISVMLAMGMYGGGEAYAPATDPVRIVMCLAILGTVLGFVPYNFNPANIFMGDAGSLLLGYLCVTTILLLAENGEPTLAMAGLMVFALPILDTSLAIVRRKVRGQPIFSPDNQHLHHQLIRSGLSVKKAVLVLYGVAGAFAIMGASLTLLRLRYVAAIFIVFFAFMAVTAYKVGHRQHLAIQATGKARGRRAAAREQTRPPGDPPLPSDTHSPSPRPEQPDQPAESSA